MAKTKGATALTPREHETAAKHSQKVARLQRRLKAKDETIADLKKRNAGLRKKGK